MRALYIAPTFVLGLAVDQRFGSWGQIAVDAWVWALFIYLLVRAAPVERTSLLICLLYATAGEIFLSLIWGLYEYRQHNIPLFVPPGHAMLFLLGTLAARRVPDWSPWVVVAALGAYVAYAAVSGLGMADLPLFGLFLACFAVRRGRRLYGVMVLLALGLELLGTGIGNWTWAHKVPGLGLTSTNPPALAGAFYCVLDLLVVATLAKIDSEKQLIRLDAVRSRKLH